ncbi:MULTISPECIES: hypothetical protein [Thermomonosporaceae]|nr:MULTISPECIES: hypothetical protein [Thermomonosporaceae]MDL4777371.1 hypothetical protein [Actinomadura xylanilytica]
MSSRLTGRPRLQAGDLPPGRRPAGGDEDMASGALPAPEAAPRTL